MNTAEKLTLLADHLEKIPAKAIRLEDWKCGTVACAVGHACSIPAFKKMGLRLSIPDDDHYPIYVDEEGWGAVEMFFEINEDESTFLFSRYTECQLENPKRHVIKRLREFAANRGQS